MLRRLPPYCGTRTCVAFEEIPQRELRDKIPLQGHRRPPIRCIRRNPTKGIERLPRVLEKMDECLGLLHSKKSHKGNWETYPTSSILFFKNSNVAFEEIPQRELRVARLPPDVDVPAIFELHSKKSHKGNWEMVLNKPTHYVFHTRLCCIRRNPTKGIESYMQISLSVRVCFEMVLHSKKSHKGNWETTLFQPQPPYAPNSLLHSKKSHKGNWES